MGDDQARSGVQLRAGNGLLLRGRQVTRIETFVDAALAFSLTLLVLFQNDLPRKAGAA
jgi:hypothetical protein